MQTRGTSLVWGTPGSVGTALRPTTRKTIPQLPFIVMVVAMAYAGLNSAWAMVGAGERPPATGESIATSFGSITVVALATIGGLSADDLGGMTHGIQGLVTADKAEVRVSVTLENTSDRTVAVTPSQFTLWLDGAPDPIAPYASTLGTDRLHAGSRIETALVFIIPRNDTGLTVAYTSPKGQQVTIATGRLDLGAQPSDDGHGHP